MWMSEDTLQKLVLSFSYVGPRDGTQAVRLSGKCLNLLSHLTAPATTEETRTVGSFCSLHMEPYLLEEMFPYGKSVAIQRNKPYTSLETRLECLHLGPGS